MSAGGGKSVERFDCTSGGAQFCNGCYTMTLDSDGGYVRHEDYAKLEQQRAALVEALIWYQQQCLAMDRTDWEGSKAKIALREDGGQRARAALRAAGVATKGGLEGSL